MGDPMAGDTQVGPITTRPQYDKVLSYIDIAKQDGAQLALGGKPGSQPQCGTRWFVAPTIFDDVQNDIDLDQAQVDGRILDVIKRKTEAQAEYHANNI